MKYKLLNSIADIPSNLIDSAIPLMMDTETIGLYGRVRLLQLYQAHWDEVILVDNPVPLDTVLLLNDKHVVCHNASYDITTLQRQAGGFWCPERLDDTLYLSRLMYYAEEKFSLDECIGYAIGFNPYDELSLEGKKDLQKTGWDNPVLSEAQMRYAAFDVFYMQKLYDAVKEMKDDQNYVLDMHTLHSNLRMQTNGIPVDKDEIHKLFVKIEAEIEDINLAVNCNAPAKVAQHLGIQGSTKKLVLAIATAKGKAKNATEAEKAHGIECARVRRCRELKKQRSYLVKANQLDDRMYGIFKPGARSGRSTCDHENLQNIPRALRNIFAIPDDGELEFMYSDYPQLELMCVCAVTGEPIMEKVYREGGDYHTDRAIKLFSTPTPSKDQRTVAKKCNFSFVYGVGGEKYRDMLVEDTGVLLTVSECQAMKSRWLNGLPVISKWQKRGISDWRAGRAWSTPMGRRYVAKMMTDQLNIQIQGMGAEVAKLANHYMNKEFAFRATQCPSYADWQDWQLNFVHDSYLLLTPIAKREEIAPIIATAMKDSWSAVSQACVIKDLPMTVEVSTGFNLGELEAGNAVWEYTQ